MTSTSTHKATYRYPEQHERDAARRYLEHDYASEHLSGKPAHEANRNAQAIDEEHPRARDIALTGTERELGKLPKHLRAHQLQARARAGIRPEHVERIRREYRTGPYREPEGDETTGERRRRILRQAPREAASAARTAAPKVAGAAVSAAAGGARELVETTDDSTGGLISYAILGALGLSLLYLLLTRIAAISKLSLGAANVTKAVVSPYVDPLNPKGALP